ARAPTTARVARRAEAETRRNAGRAPPGRRPRAGRSRVRARAPRRPRRAEPRAPWQARRSSARGQAWRAAAAAPRRHALPARAADAAYERARLRRAGDA